MVKLIMILQGVIGLKGLWKMELSTVATIQVMASVNSESISSETCNFLNAILEIIQSNVLDNKCKNVL